MSTIAITAGSNYISGGAGTAGGNRTMSVAFLFSLFLSHRPIPHNKIVR